MDFIPAKTLVSGYADQTKWFGVNYNMNIYKGCSHGCIYCDSRSECYHVENFDQVRAKENALALIERDLKSKRKTGVVGTGAMSDPYNPYEKEYELTRGALKLIKKYGFGLAIATKSHLIIRDIDILKEIAAQAPVIVKITVTAADDALSRLVEPNVAVSSQRFEAIQKLLEAGIYVGVLMMPILPFIEDDEANIKGIIEKAHQSGARFIFPGFGVTLRQNQRDYFLEQLDLKFPGYREKYEKTYGYAYSCSSPNAKRLWQMLKTECDRYGMVYRMEDIISGYKKPQEPMQLSFF